MKGWEDGGVFLEAAEGNMETAEMIRKNKIDGLMMEQDRFDLMVSWALI